MNHSKRLALTQLAYKIQMIEHKLEIARRAQLSEGWPFNNPNRGVDDRADRADYLPGFDGSYFRDNILPGLRAAGKSKQYIKGFYDAMVHGGGSGSSNPDYEQGQTDGYIAGRKAPEGHNRAAPDPNAPSDNWLDYPHLVAKYAPDMLADLHPNYQPPAKRKWGLKPRS